MPDRVELRGRPASPGIAGGPLFRLDTELAHHTPSQSAEAERDALQAAVTLAIEQITGLIAEADAEAAAILELQAFILADDELLDPALGRIDAETGAASAWLAAMAEQIAGYEASEDEYFRARAADLADLRDRVLRNLSGVEITPPPAGAILIGGELTPSRFLETDWSAGGGIVLFNGSPTSHVAMLARSRSVPMVVGVGPIACDEHGEAIVDGATGAVTLSPTAGDRAASQVRRMEIAGAAKFAERYLHADATTRDGTRIRVMINVARPEEVDNIDVEACDGVGLMRTEFLFTGGALPDEETQYRAYSRVLDWAAGRPVTIRTVDAGGDKPVEGLTVAEPNPFLGLRGIRLSLARPEVLALQLRALARAAMHGDLKVMLPMVTVPEEIVETRRLFDTALSEATERGAPARCPPLGIMVEVPATAIMPERFTAAEFFSVGSNDLTQYVTAAARDSHRVANLCDVRNPAVMHLIGNVARFGARSGIDVSLCGDAAGDPTLVPQLLKAGLRTLSVAPSALGAVKAAIAGATVDE